MLSIDMFYIERGGFQSKFNCISNITTRLNNYKSLSVWYEIEQTKNMKSFSTLVLVLSLLYFISIHGFIIQIFNNKANQILFDIIAIILIHWLFVIVSNTNYLHMESLRSQTRRWVLLPQGNHNIKLLEWILLLIASGENSPCGTGLALQLKRANCSSMLFIR